MVKEGSRPMLDACWRSRRAPTEWNVPDQGDGGRSAGLGAAKGCGADALDPPLHLARRPAAEGQEQDAAWIGIAEDQMGHPVGERVGLARSRPGDDQQGRRRCFPDAMNDGIPLGGIQAGEVTLTVRGIHGREHSRRAESPEGIVPTPFTMPP